MTRDGYEVRIATPADAAQTAVLLHDFNTEFASPTPGAAVLAERLTMLLGGETTFAVLADRPPNAVALVTLRTNVWYDGPVALLDEMYVRPELRARGIGSAVLRAAVNEARVRGAGLFEVNVDEPDHDALRFYVRHGFTAFEPDTGARAFYLHRELA